MADKLDLRTVIDPGQLSVAPGEHVLDRKFRLRKEARGALIEDVKGIIVFGVVLLAIISIGALSAYKGFFDATATAEVQKWGQQILNIVAASSISFVIGRKVGK